MTRVFPLRPDSFFENKQSVDYSDPFFAIVLLEKYLLGKSEYLTETRVSREFIKLNEILYFRKLENALHVDFVILRIVVLFVHLSIPVHQDPGILEGQAIILLARVLGLLKG